MRTTLLTKSWEKTKRKLEISLQPPSLKSTNNMTSADSRNPEVFQECQDPASQRLIFPDPHFSTVFSSTEALFNMGSLRFFPSKPWRVLKNNKGLPQEWGETKENTVKNMLKQPPLWWSGEN